MTVTRDPVTHRSRMLLCFAAWQRAQGRGDLTEAGAAWLAFSDWWDRRDLSYFANDRQLARAAWNGSSGRFESQITTDDDRARFEAWWIGVHDAKRKSRVDPRFSSHPVVAHE